MLFEHRTVVWLGWPAELRPGDHSGGPVGRVQEGSLDCRLEPVGPPAACALHPDRDCGRLSRRERCRACWPGDIYTLVGLIGIDVLLATASDAQLVSRLQPVLAVVGGPLEAPGNGWPRVTDTQGDWSGAVGEVS